MTTHDQCCACNPLPEALLISTGNRRFIRLATLGTGISLLGLATPWRLVAAEAGHGTSAHIAEALLLSSMDYRLNDAITRYMDSRGMTN